MIHIYIMYLPISEKNDGNRTGQKHRTEHEAGTELLAVGLRELYGMEMAAWKAISAESPGNSF